MRYTFLLLLHFSACTSTPSLTNPLPAPVATVEHPDIKEGSGLTESRTMPGTFWVLNDGGNNPVLYLMDKNGRDLGTVEIDGVQNKDWETLATDDSGNLWIGDVGNNENMRKDLTLYKVSEPKDADEMPPTLKVNRKIRITYPDQTEIPPVKYNFDCEAMFFFDGALYFLTKHRADRDTKLYRLKLEAAGDDAELEYLERFPSIGQVTAADLHADGKRLAVLTFSGIWIFERPEGSDHFLSGSVKSFTFPGWSLRQIEGIAWLGDNELLITNEQRDMFRVPTKLFVRNMDSPVR
jgi:hypothetical protein